MKKETKPTAKSIKKSAAKQKEEVTEVTESTKEVQPKLPKTKTVKAIVLKRFYGVEEDKLFAKGKTFEGSLERVEYLTNKGFVRLVSVEID